MKVEVTEKELSVLSEALGEFLFNELHDDLTPEEVEILRVAKVLNERLDGMDEEQQEQYGTARAKLVEDIAALFSAFQEVPYMDHTDLMKVAAEAHDRVVLPELALEGK